MHANRAKVIQRISLIRKVFFTPQSSHRMILISCMDIRAVHIDGFVKSRHPGKTGVQLKDQNFLIAHSNHFLIQRLLPFNGQAVASMIVGIRLVGGTYKLWRFFQVRQRPEGFQG
jgi:hypothetical protein